MTVVLDQPLSWTSASEDTAAMLQQLQANILKAHVADHLMLWCCRFADGGTLRAFLRAARPLVKSAATHLAEAREFAATGRPGTPYVGIALTATGYELLDLAATHRPFDPSFLAGARARIGDLGDPALDEWQQAQVEPFDVLVLIGDTDVRAVARSAKMLRPMLGRTTRVHVERGRTMRNGAGRPIEHFGYVDGISQPLALTEDVAAARSDPHGWDPTVPLGQMITIDHGVPGSTSAFGSYLVFRKLEQHVRDFATATRDLADRLVAAGTDAMAPGAADDRAGALLIGRYRDGTPLVSSPAPAGTPGQRPANGFGYRQDVEGNRCPLHAHIRKLNARGTGSAVELGGLDSATLERMERSHMMARRGITYGVRTDDPDDPSVPPEARPIRGVGLLFMAVGSTIRDQFEFQQRRWANNPNFPTASVPPGLDPLIGSSAAHDIQCPARWGGSASVGVALPRFVGLLGAEYGFLPSLAFLAEPGPPEE